MRAKWQDAATKDLPAATLAAQLPALGQLLQLVGERSGLILDPQANTYELMLLSTLRTEPWMGAVATLLPLGRWRSGSRSSGVSTPPQKVISNPRRSAPFSPPTAGEK